MSQKTRLVELVSRVAFPALFVLASVVVLFVFGARLLAHQDGATRVNAALLTKRTDPNATGYSIRAPDAPKRTGVATARGSPVLDVKPAPEGTNRQIAARSNTGMSVDNGSGSEIDRLRGHILRVAAEFPGSSRVTVLVRRLTALSPLEALACVAQLSDDAVRADAVAIIANDWVAQNPTAAIAACSGFRESPVGREFHRDVVQQLARTKPGRALSLVKSVASRDDSLDLLGEVFRHWTTSDPRMATARALELEPGRERSELLVDVLSIWTRMQMNEAVRAVIVLPQNGERRIVLAGVARRLAHENSSGISLSTAFVRAVMVRAGQAMDERERDELVVAAIDVLGAIDAGIVPPFLDTLPSGYDRSALLLRLVGEAARVDPYRAIAYAVQCPSGGADRVAALRVAASGMVRLDDSAALSWLGSLANAEDRAAATQAVLFGIKDLNLAERWLQGRLGKPDTDATIQAFALRVAREDPPLAASWARQIRDNSLRYFAIEAVARAWLQTNRPASEAWLARTDLPEPRVSRLLAR